VICYRLAAISTVSKSDSETAYQPAIAPLGSE
jgi:hypothetical protein